ncbi:TerB family tellurite resistance protein [Mesorhizobium sp. CAU 1732]|uniref:tellurite resistance TerB family protein n=1 Tax=Mesorhizobium sp. CAU 1732 TaxID=3140358 RepID=UPI00326035A1
MLDRLKSFFGTLTEKPREDALGVDDPRVAAAALMVHIIDADGVRDEVERKRLRDLLADAYGLSGNELDQVVSAGEEAEREAVDLFAFTSVLNRSLDEAKKVDLIALLWEIVYADGEMHELEDNIVWRVSELIGVSPRDRMLMRQRVRDELGLSGLETGD